MDKLLADDTIGQGEPPLLREAQEREAIAARLGAEGDFLRVPQLAKALGISAKSLHAQMRAGSFPMPHRRVGRVIVVKLDHYVDWFLSESPPACDLSVQSNDGELGPAKALSNPEERPASVCRDAIRASRRAAGERFKQEVLRGMRSKGFDV